VLHLHAASERDLASSHRDGDGLGREKEGLADQVSLDLVADLLVRARESPHEIGPRHDADERSSLDDGQAVDPALGHRPGASWPARRPPR
jgi:hypothetical protein